MNQSLLQKAFGVSWHYRCGRVECRCGSVQFYLDLKPKALVCPECGLAEAVIRKGRRSRVLQTAEEIAAEYPHLQLAQVYAALAYYHANRQEVEADITAEEADSERIEQEHLRVLRAKG